MKKISGFLMVAAFLAFAAMAAAQTPPAAPAEPAPAAPAAVAPAAPAAVEPAPVAPAAAPAVAPAPAVAEPPKAPDVVKVEKVAEAEGAGWGTYGTIIVLALALGAALLKLRKKGDATPPKA